MHTTSSDTRAAAIPRQLGLPPRLRVAVVDDDLRVRSTLRQVLTGEDIDVAAAIESTQLLEILACRMVDVVLCDVEVALAARTDWLKRACSRPAPVIALLASTVEPDVVLKAVQAGVRGYLLKDSSTVLLQEAVHALARGLPVWSPAALAPVLVHCRQGDLERQVSDRLALLTEREMQVLSVLGEGAENSAVAQALGLSLATVKSHVATILRKLQVANRVQAAILATQAGISGL